MGPPKFRAPLRANGQHSFSSAFSSSSSFGSVNQNVKAGEVSSPPLQQVVQPILRKDTEGSSSQTPNESLKSKDTGALEDKSKLVHSVEGPSSQTPNESVKNKDTGALEHKRKLVDGGIPKPSKIANEPPHKKMKIDFASTSSKATEPGENNRQDEDKENVCPKSKKQPDNKQSAKPCVSLTDEQYDCIFDAVLGRQHVENSTNKATSKNKNSLDHSKDLFEFSQSDLDDSEEEQTETAKKDTAVCLEGKKDSPIIEGKLPSTAVVVEKDIANEAGTKSVPSGMQEDLKNTDKEDSKVDTQEAASQGTSVMEFKDVLTTTPQIEKRADSQEGAPQGTSVTECENVLTITPQIEKMPPLQDLDAFVTPQKAHPVQKVLGLSQEQNRSPVGKTATTPVSQQSQLLDAVTSPLQKARPVQKVLGLSQEQNRSPVGKTTTTPVSQQSQLLDAVTSPQNASSAAASQNSQAAPSPLCTPRQPSTSQKSYSSSQGHKTSNSTPSVLQTPSKQSVTDILASTPITPSASQQFSQEICLTPPPKNVSAKERLLWLQKKRLTGLWVQCDNKECGKWRYLDDCHDPTTLPDNWFCQMHPDEEFNNCDAPEKRLSLRAEEDMIYNKYSPGSLVWAKLSGFPWWPAMVDDDPDLEQFYWLNGFSDIPTWYHVVFFDDEEKTSCCRAWVPVQRLKEFTEEPLDNESAEIAGYKKKVKLAYKEACQAKLCGLEDRLAQFSFASRYKGPIGGFFTKTYDGPVGFREPVSKE